MLRLRCWRLGDGLVGIGVLGDMGVFGSLQQHAPSSPGKNVSGDYDCLKEDIGSGILEHWMNRSNKGKERIYLF